jgi:4-hydroxybenzoate polyprenyltransferase
MKIKWQEYDYGRVDWILAMRPINCIFAAITVVLCFGFSNLPWASGIKYALAVFVIYAATIVWSDYFDRNIDKNKNKLLAYNNPKVFLTYSLILWVISIIYVLILAKHANVYVDLILIFLVSIGLLYTIAEHTNSIWKNGSVAICCGVICLFPFAITHNINHTVFSLMLILIFSAYAREILKDIEDSVIDDGGKKTLIRSYSHNSVSTTVNIFLLLSVAASISLYPSGLINIPFLIISYIALAKNNYKKAQISLKVGIMALLLMLFVVFKSYFR